MRKFILIDPSIRELGGHYYEYATRVLEAARRHGFEPILGANRGARPASQSWHVVPVYRYGFFEPGPPRVLRWAHRMATLALRSVGPSLPIATNGAGAGGAYANCAANFRRKRRAFMADSVRLFQRVPLNAGDVVFLPTVAEADILGLADLFRVDRNTAKAAWHLLFRRDVPTGSGARQRLRRHFERFQGQLSGCHVSFYTDTERLTAQYKGLGGPNFHTLPIPIQNDRGTGRPALEFGPGERLRHIVYLGDARTEKGYHWLPHLVADARAARLPVRFTFQSNFNVPGGEPLAAKARAELESLRPAHDVTLLTEPLSSEAYFRLLLSADVVVVPYDASAYRARSSGVFAEALGAGKPVIVPAGTWMAEELRRAGGKCGAVYQDARDLTGHLAEILAEYDTYHAAAHDYSHGWSHRHCAEALLKQIVLASWGALGSEVGLVPLCHFA